MDDHSVLASLNRLLSGGDIPDTPTPATQPPEEDGESFVDTLRHYEEIVNGKKGDMPLA